MISAGTGEAKTERQRAALEVARKISSPLPRNDFLKAAGVSAAVVAGTLGSYLGSRRFPVRTISLLLASVLVIAGFKLIFTR